MLESELKSRVLICAYDAAAVITAGTAACSTTGTAATAEPGGDSGIHHNSEGSCIRQGEGQKEQGYHLLEED